MNVQINNMTIFLCLSYVSFDSEWNILLTHTSHPKILLIYKKLQNLKMNYESNYLSIHEMMMIIKIYFMVRLSKVNFKGRHH